MREAEDPPIYVHIEDGTPIRNCPACGAGPEGSPDCELCNALKDAGPVECTCTYFADVKQHITDLCCPVHVETGHPDEVAFMQGTNAPVESLSDKDPAG